MWLVITLLMTHYQVFIKYFTGLVKSLPGTPSSHRSFNTTCHSSHCCYYYCYQYTYADKYLSIHSKFFNTILTPYTWTKFHNYFRKIKVSTFTSHNTLQFPILTTHLTHSKVPWCWHHSGSRQTNWLCVLADFLSWQRGIKIVMVKKMYFSLIQAIKC